MNLFSLAAKISLDDKQFNQGVDKSEKNFMSFAKGIGTAVAGMKIVGLTKDIIKLGIETNAMAETSGIAWETLLGSQEKSKKMLDDIAKFAATTPFEKMGVDNMAKQLHNAGFEGQGLFDQLTKFGDIGGAFGIQSASLEEMVRQYSQVKQAGVAYTEDLNILQDRGVPIYKAIAEQLGITTGEVKKWASEGKISADIYQQALDSVATSVEGGMAKQSKSFTGMVSTFKDGMTELAGILAQPVFDFLKQALQTVQPIMDQFIATLKEDGLVAAFTELNPILGFFASNIQQCGIWLQQFGTFVIQNIEPLTLLAVSLGGALAALKAFAIVTTVIGWIQGAITAFTTFMGAVKGATVAQTLFNIALMANPIGIIIGLIGALVAAFIYLWNTNDAFRNFWIEMWGVVKQMFIDVWNSIVEFCTVTIPQLIENISTWFSELPGKLKQWFDETIGEAIMWQAEMVAKGIVAAREFVDKVNTYIKELPGKVWIWLLNTIQKAQQWATDMGNKAKEAAKNMVDNVINGIKKLPSDVMSIGKDIVRGLWDGISGMGGWLWGKVSGFASNILTTAKNALGIHSPSREFAREVGQWIPPGIERGMEKTMPNLDTFVNESIGGLTNSVDVGQVNYSRYGVAPQTQASQVNLSLNIENFYNNDDNDIEDLAYRLTEYIKGQNLAVGNLG